MKDWMRDDILVCKAIRRKNESLWRKSRLTVQLYYESCMAVKKAISKSTSRIFQNIFSGCNTDQKKLLRIVDT